MDDNAETSAWSERCRCGKRFFQPNSFTYHIQGCSTYKKGVGTSLEAARARWQAKADKPRKGKEAIQAWYGEGDLDVDHEIAPPAPNLLQVQRQDTVSSAWEPDVSPQLTRLQPEPPPTGRGHRVAKPVKRYDNNFEATSTMPLHFVPDTPPRANSPTASSAILPAQDQAPPALNPSEKQRSSILDRSTWRRTMMNEFGLTKHYWTLEPRPHDPDAHITRSDIMDHDPVDESDSRTGERPTGEPRIDNRYYPFPNFSSYLIGQWFWTDQEKGRKSLQQLVAIITSDGFRPEELLLANWDGIQASLGSSEFEDSETAWADDGASWRTASVTIDVPFNSNSLNPGSEHYTVDGFRFRPLVTVIRARLQDEGHCDHFHFVPYELQWKPSGSASQHRVYGEMYCSPAYVDAYKEIQSLPPEPEEDHLPRYIVALMFSSDGTTLASFGNKSLWPLYMWFGNESKHRRAKVSLGLVEHIAHFQKLPDSFQDWYIRLSGKPRVGSPVATHVHRELFHEQWRTLLDEEFVHAYCHGLVIDCTDGVRRRFYPRIMTYSADYPEKTIVVSIRDLGQFPCPRCLVSLGQIPAMGLPSDRLIRTSLTRVDNAERQKKVEEARKLIYRENLSVNSKRVDSILKPTSLVPTQNSFSELLSGYGLDIYNLIAVDVLHEVEIGVWKSLFIQLLRILELVDPVLTNTLNHRFRVMPTFGKDTIRRFSNNMSDMKQLAARDWEDMLQVGRHSSYACCATFVFEGLFPGEHGAIIHDLLFTLGHWHGLAKLRMHTDLSLEVLDQWTTMLGEDARTFTEKTCSAFRTVELKREYEARKRSEARRSKNAATAQRSSAQSAAGVPSEIAESSTTDDNDTPAPGGLKSKRTRKSGKATVSSSSVPTPSSHQHVAASELFGSEAVQMDHTQNDAALRAGASDRPTGSEGSGERKARTWNLNTPKFHALGDVVAYIRRFGTTDSYSTQLSERAHRLSKSRYRKTNKKDVSRQLSRIQTRQARLQRLKRQLNPSFDELASPYDFVGPADGRRWYFIGKSQNQPVNLGHFISTNVKDLAVTGFLPKLKRHLFPRVIEALIHDAQRDAESHAPSLPILKKLLTSFREDDLSNLHFHSDRIYLHRVFKIRYTTYDCRADHDTFNAATSKRDFMSLREMGNSAAGSSGDQGRYVYGRILGVFHGNIRYTGPGAVDTKSRRFDFLWVRWFLQVGNTKGWLEKQHDVLSLAPLTAPNACGFMDPTDVLRAAHIVPRFSSQPLYDPDGKDADRPFSKHARDRTDWAQYFVNRLVDRDMLMRFHPNLTPGHAAHVPDTNAVVASADRMDQDAPVRWEGDPEGDAQMMEDSSTDSGDSGYDPLLLRGDLADDEEEEQYSSDAPEPDSCSDTLDTFQSSGIRSLPPLAIHANSAWPSQGGPTTLGWLKGQFDCCHSCIQKTMSFFPVDYIYRDERLTLDATITRAMAANATTASPLDAPLDQVPASSSKEESAAAASPDAILILSLAATAPMMRNLGGRFLVDLEIAYLCASLIASQSLLVTTTSEVEHRRVKYASLGEYYFASGSRGREIPAAHTNTTQSRTRVMSPCLIATWGDLPEVPIVRSLPKRTMKCCRRVRELSLHRLHFLNGFKFQMIVAPIESRIPIYLPRTNISIANKCHLRHRPMRSWELKLRTLEFTPDRLGHSPV
ncbi:hypothetical protein NMY22_g8044 [Coprinellus aureogranulatus]|nr:hypothetical protein NMY22_g8044 [Coprinellus aureogranulatus]